MSRIKETFKVDVGDTEVEVIHDGKRSFDEQEEGKKNLMSYLEEELHSGEYEGFMPYDNFECSIEWKVIWKE